MTTVIICMSGVNKSFHISRPWLSEDSASEFAESYYAETQDKIDTCLSCPLSECRDCMEHKASSDSKLNDFKTLLGTGLSIKKICETLNISRRTYYNWKKQVDCETMFTNASHEQGGYLS